MANIHTISAFLDTELGEAIDSVVNPSGYGSATFLIKEFMEKHKDQLITFWSSQGKDGNAIYDKWFAKWSRTKEQQNVEKKLKEKQKHDKTVKQYLALGVSPEQAEEYANAFPDTDPIEVIKIRTYATQNNPKQSKEEQKLKEDIALCEIRLKEKSGNASYWESRKRKDEAQLEAILTVREKEE